MCRALRKTDSLGRSRVPMTLLRIRVLRRIRCSDFVFTPMVVQNSCGLVRLLRAGLAGLPLDPLLGVLDSLAFVRLRRFHPTDGGRRAAQLFLVDAGELDDGVFLDR